MKFLIAFAVIAVAFAAEQVQVVHLPAAPAPTVESLPDIGLLIVPQHILDIVNSLPVENADILRVNFVDSPIEPEHVLAYDATFAEEAIDESLKVMFVDSPLEDVQAAPEQIKVVELPLAESRDVSDDLKVRVVDIAPVVEAFEADEESLKVRFVDSPVEAENIEAVRVAEPVFQNVPSVDAIKVVDAPRLGKVFADPRLR